MPECSKFPAHHMICDDGHSIWSFTSGSSANRNFSIWPYSRLLVQLTARGSSNAPSVFQDSG